MGTLIRKPTEEVVLNHLIGYSDFCFSNLENMNSTNFPPQDTDRIGTTVSLWYMTEKYHGKESGIFEVVRWDKGAPNRVILINNRLQMVLVSSPEHVIDDGTGQLDENGHPVANKYIHPYPIQQYELLGVETKDRYTKDLRSNTGMILRVDMGGDDLQVVLIEDMGNGKSRFVTLEETKAALQRGDIHVKTHEEFKEIWNKRMEGLNLEVDTVN